MGWIAWLASTIALFLIGAHFFRAGSKWIVRSYVGACLFLFVMHFMNVAIVFGADYVSWPKYVMFAFLPGTAILVVWAIKRDREEVMGRPGDREATATAAIVYGAGSYAEVGDIGGGMDSQ